MAKPIVNLRMEEELIEELDARAKDLGVSRSALIRMMLRTAVESPAIEAALAEAWFIVRPAVFDMLVASFDQVKDIFPAIIDDTLAEYAVKLNGEARMKEIDAAAAEAE